MTTRQGLLKRNPTQVLKCFEFFRRKSLRFALISLLFFTSSAHALDEWSYSSNEVSAAEARAALNSEGGLGSGSSLTPTTAFFTPLEWLEAWMEDGLKATQPLFDLVQYMRKNTSKQSRDDLLAALPKYDRVELFGGWINEDGPANCYNTRAEVLLRDSDPNEKVHFAPGNKCMVVRARWDDPYSATPFKLANAVQVDHVVPLKAAYLSGAHAWSENRRCRYANFLNDPTHLLTVSGHENMSKGDAGPERYLPPNPRFICQYLHLWMKVKAIWGMEYPAEEAAAIHQALNANNCPASAGTLPVQDHKNLQAESLRPIAKCGDVEP